MDKSSLPGPKVAAMALLAAVAIPVVSASAQTTTFIIDGTEGASTYSNTTNGITMTLSDPAETASGRFAFGQDSIGGFGGHGELDLTSTNTGYVTAFDLSFDASVQIVSYTVGVIDDRRGIPPAILAVTPTDSFTLSIGGVATSSGNDLSTTGSHTLAGVFLLPSGVTGNFDTANSIQDGFTITLESITVQAVPEPRTWTLLGLGGLFALAMRRWRRARLTA